MNLFMEEEDDNQNPTFAEMMSKAGMDSGEIKLSKKAQYLKETGNYHFSEFKKREKLMSHERKRMVLNWAIQSYETAYAICKRALRKNKAREEAEATEVMLRKERDRGEDSEDGEIVVVRREEVIDLMKSLAKNAAIMYMYLAKVETVPGVKSHCFNKSAEVSPRSNM